MQLLIGCPREDDRLVAEAIFKAMVTENSLN